MVDPQTANLQLFTPANGADPGTWDVPMNANSNQLEAVLTGVTTITLGAANITLSAAQYNSAFITFNGTIVISPIVTFPTFARTWTLFNTCAQAASLLTVICKTSASVNYVALPPNEPVQVYSDGRDLRFINFGRVGSYMDLASISVPAWISQTVPPPYLLCDGSAFSSATYPTLRDLLPSANVPDARGRFRAAANSGTGRLQNNSGTLSVDGNTLLSAGGTIQLSSQIMPAYGLPVTDSGHVHGISPTALSLGGPANVAGGADIGIQQTPNVTQSSTTGVTVNSGGSGAFFTPPAFVGGVTFIRAG